MSNVASTHLHHRFIASDRVEGGHVVGLDDVLLGKITRLHIDRVSGKVTSAIIFRPGHFGFESVEHEIPWDALRFDFATEGFRTDIKKCDPPKSFIPSDRVEGMGMYHPDGANLGKIKRMLIDKISGRVDCVVVIHHGRLGIGTEEYRISWADLHFDPLLGGFRVSDSRALRPVPAENRDVA